MKTKLPGGYSFIFIFCISSFLFLSVFSCKKKSDDDCPVCPVVNSVTPASGKHGDTITISGKNFSSDFASQTIKFNGKPVETGDILSGTTEQIRVRVPLKCGTGPVTVALDADLFSEGGPVFTYITTQVVTVFAGTPGVSGNPSTTVSLGTAQFNSPGKLIIDNTGALCVLDVGNNKVKKFDASVNAFRTISTSLTTPRGLALDKNDNLYFAQTSIGSPPYSCNVHQCIHGSFTSSSIRTFTLTNDGASVLDMACDPLLNPVVSVMNIFGDGGYLLRVHPIVNIGIDTIILNGPFINSMCVKDSFLFAYDNFFNGAGTVHMIIRMNLNTYRIDTLAGNTECNGFFTTAMAIKDNTVYLSNSTSHQVYFLNSAGHLIAYLTTIFDGIGGMVFDANGDLYISETNQHCIKKISNE